MHTSKMRTSKNAYFQNAYFQNAFGLRFWRSKANFAEKFDGGDGEAWGQRKQARKRREPEDEKRK